MRIRREIYRLHIVHRHINPSLPAAMWTFYFLLSILFSSYQTTLLQLNKRPVFRSSSDSNNVIEEALGNVLVVRKLVSEQDSQIETLKDEVNSLQSSLENISAEKLCSLYINRTYGLMDDIDFLMKDAEANVTKLEKKNLMLQKAVLSSKEVITFNTVRLAETKQQLKSAELRIDSKDKLILEAIKELGMIRSKLKLKSVSYLNIYIFNRCKLYLILNTI